MALASNDKSNTKTDISQIIVPIFVGILMLYMYISAFYYSDSGIFHTIYSEACSKASGGWKAGGIVLNLIGIFGIIKAADRGLQILGGAFIALGLLLFTGFNF